MGVEIAGQYFRSKVLAKEYLSGIMRSVPVGEYIGAGGAEVFREVLDRHPRAAEKIGTGVRGFRPIKTRFNTVGIEVVRTDGTSIDFSFYKCLDGESSRTLAFSAFRNAVAATVIAFRDENFAGVSEYSGAHLYLRDAHVDHAPPWQFRVIVAEWLKTHDLPTTLPHPDGVGRVLLEEEAEEFLAFHNERAVLRLVSKRENLSDLRRVANAG